MRSSGTAPCGSVPAPIIELGRSALDFLLPPHCAACDARVATAGLLCASCFAATRFIGEPCCDRCGVAFSAQAEGGQARLCLDCETDPPLFRRARAALTYDEQGRRLILPFKHADKPELAHLLAPHMTRAGADLLRDADVLVPVPLHRRRLFARRYNQAALLALALGRLTGLAAIPDGLRRVRNTASLGQKTATERAQEIVDAFAVRPGRADRLAGKAVVLIDDVMTSGATANACATVLLDAGARSVDVLVAARVPSPRADSQEH